MQIDQSELFTEAVPGQSLDISIKQLKSYVFEPKTPALRQSRANEIVGQSMVVTEKVDGTKLTLVRTAETNTSDYAVNWIVSYKGSVLHGSEFSHLSDKDREQIKTQSIGIGQYVWVFDHLKKINPNIASIPTNTEFSVEFAQNKDTLSRTYERFGDMFLRSFAPVKYRVISGQLHTTPTGAEETDPTKLAAMAKRLQVQTFPIYFSGKLTREAVDKNQYLGPKMKGVNWADPLDVLQKFSDAVLTIPSVLGGKIEGAVMRMADGRFFKVVQSDQYDAEARGAKKDLYRMSPEEMDVYFQKMRKVISVVLNKIGTEGKTDTQIVSQANKVLSRIPIDKFPANPKRNETQIRDDAHETLRLMVGKRDAIGVGTKTIGLIPIAGKPLHIGHWKLIERAAAECDRVIVYTTSKDRAEKGQVPISGADFVYFWHDFFIPALPKNVKVRFVDSPVRAVLHELSWFEQSATKDSEDVPTVKLYSDVSDVDANFPDADLGKFPTLKSTDKIQKVGVERSSTVNISGTKMREFLQSGDMASFIKNLPPIPQNQKKEIWTTLMKNVPQKEQIDPYKQMAHELIESYFASIDEGGWRVTDTQSTRVTPELVKDIVGLFDKFVDDFNAQSNLPPIKSMGPVGSAAYYKSDLGDPNVIYGDVDMQIVYPIESNDREEQLASNKSYAAAIRTFIKEKSPTYIHDNLNDPEYGKSYLVFNVGSSKAQIDLVISYTSTAKWVKTRTTPERGLKGFVSGLLMSALGDALNASFGSTTNPYLKISEVAVGRKFLESDTVFLDIVKYYAHAAGLRSVKTSALRGNYSLDDNDPSFKRKCEHVVALANALEDNDIFDAGVVTSIDGRKFRNRQEFIDYIRTSFIKRMNDQKTAKKMDKASTPEALQAVEKVRAHADRGIEMATQLLKESGQAVASVGPKPDDAKMVAGEPAKATTKLSIVDDDKSIADKVSADIKEFVKALNSRVHFWKDNNPYIDNGYIFNGSSQHLINPETSPYISQYKPTFGDVDLIVPKSKLEDLRTFLDSIDDNKIDWKPTAGNKITNKFHYIGRTKSSHSIPDQIVALWWYVPKQQIVQIDFEGDDMTTDKKGFERPSDWTKFTKDSPYNDLQAGIKGLAGALMLRALARATTRKDSAVVVKPTSAAKIAAGQTIITDKDIRIADGVPDQATGRTLNPAGGRAAGLRTAYKKVGDVTYNGKSVEAYVRIEPKDVGETDRTTDIVEIFKTFFGKKPTADELKVFRSFTGLLTLMKKYLDMPTITYALDKFDRDISPEHLSDKEWAAIYGAIQKVLGVKRSPPV